MNENLPAVADEPEVGLLQAFHDDEEGLEVLQVVLIIALAALIFVLIRFFWNTKVKPAAKAGVDKAVENIETDSN